MSSPTEADYVIVGAGSAGCVLAARLSESGKHRVALLEAGGEDDNFWIRVPLGVGLLTEDPTLGRYIWSYEGEPEPGLEGRRVPQPRGKVLGGTGSINGMTYVRGQREDYDHWRALGNIGWGFEDVLPYFIRSEDHELGAGTYHGTGGPTRVSIAPRHEMGDALIEAAQQAGFTRNDDYNGAVQDGFGYDQVNIRDGRRDSTVDGYLKPARGRANLQVITGALARRVLVEGGRAVGVEYLRNGAPERIMARAEVIVAAGSFNTPQLLQLSGIGPGKLLQDHGIPVLADIPEVGENLQDHVSIGLNYRCTLPITINDIVSNPLRKYAMGINYVLFRRGMMAHIGCYGTGFVRSGPSVASPDGKIRMFLVSRVPGKGPMGVHPYPGFSMSAQLIHPESRGSVKIKGPDSSTPPAILCNLLKTEGDQQTAVKLMRIAQRIAAAPAMQRYVAEEVLPGPQRATDESLLDYCRKFGSRGYHAVGSTRMGADAHAVVDPRLRVRGVDRLRVIDASIMPSITGGNTHAPTIMIAEKGSDMLLQDAQAR